MVTQLDNERVMYYSKRNPFVPEIQKILLGMFEHTVIIHFLMA